MERNTLILSRCASVLAIGLMLSLDAYAAKKKVEPVPLTAEGTKALAQYSKTLADLRAGLKNKLPTVGSAKKTAFLAAYAIEKGTIKKSKDKKGKVREELDSAFNKFTTWQSRQVVNDPQTEADMTWMREMLWNYRPDIITAPKGYRARYVGLMNTEFGHNRLEVDENDPATRIQQTINSGGQCGPKAFFGRCLNRSFGVPTWGARLRSHTAMTYWTPKGWTSILGVSWQNGFWTVDKPESMRAGLFRLGAMTRDYPEAYIKVCRAQWIGDALSEEKLDGMYSATGGLWNALALNKMRVPVIETFLSTSAIILAGLFIAAILSRIAYAISERTAQAPFLDVVISLFTWLPWVTGACLDGWKGVLAAIFAQFLAIQIFSFVDRLLRGKKGDTLTAAQGRLLGPVRNHIALLATTPATIAFVLIRTSEIFIYPVVAWLAKLPTYRQSEWVNLSRHKYDGLVGADLLWCWYCDWMTGLWSLGSEMLRNIESFWCPIRFRDDAKNRNASIDFPDVEKWVPADASLEEVVKAFEKHYDGSRPNSWWGHRDREDK